ncbi:hypothetical protein K435DRAFT_657310 [Dendrothele bispora CBS 962.96]|uniref:Golgi apparatus membrane protein TVP38 n=1 Tax=Dendrothele bispora (strain CBS 962.96) TaxID=1314807 RepID=A0A4S8MDF3_DENBC|nr:hypothetical protein K435DRAFT_657310 [Dendrothele bispora CBS 962.96]
MRTHQNSESQAELIAPVPARIGEDKFLSPYPSRQGSNPVNINLQPVQSYESQVSSSTIGRDLTRTPSPTPSEAEALNGNVQLGIDWKKFKDPKNWWMYVVVIVVVVLVVLFVVYRDNILHWLEPAARWLHDTPGGWVIPILILVILSFPPLFGHEIVAMLCGLVWGLGIGFLIVAAGTLLGELANLYVFRYFFSERSKKYERNIGYACLIRVIHEGGFWIALMIRYSLIPPHLTTTVFAVCGMSTLTFLAAAVLSLPKQLITVYLGVSLEDEADGTQTKSEKIINAVVIVVGVVVGIVAFRVINKRINEVKTAVIHDRRKAR